MFETNAYSENYVPELPEPALQRFRELREVVASQSLIVWGEHCAECGFPHCYSTCAYFTPRKDDLNCGRFVKGIERSKVGDVRLATITFRKWGKLWGTGPVGLVSPEKAESRERVGERVTRGVVRWVPSLVLRRTEWHANNWKRRHSSRDLQPADAFVIEAWLPEQNSSFAFTLTLIPGGDPEAGLFQAGFELGPGYNRCIVPAEQIAARVDLSAPYQIQIEPFEEAIGKEITFGLIEFVRLNGPLEEIRPVLSRGHLDGGHNATSKAKCVVWDLDNTVWKGTLAEDGLEGLTLFPHVRSLIEELDRRGILQSVASKNDPEPALRALDSFGLRDYFLYPQIGWGPKSSSVERIAGLLDIGLDTFVFVDDQPFERGEVGEKLSQVTVLAESDLPELLVNPRFDVPITAESVKRRAMYQAEQSRKSLFEVSTGDYVEFLRGCDITVDAFGLSDDVMERAHELSQRTNQLNVSGQRYSRSELTSMRSAESGADAFLFSCRDRFGEYGIIAMCVLSKSRAEVESFMMSCRVQRKRVEQVIFSWLARRCSTSGFDELTVRYRKTPRNDASIRMLQELGFVFCPTGDSESGVFSISTSVQIAEDDVVSLRDHTQRSEEGDVI